MLSSSTTASATIAQVGEFVAFVIGWNLTLEHVIGTASLARGYSGYLGSLFNATVHEPAKDIAVNQYLPEFLHGYVTQFDSLAFFLTMLVTALLLLGVQVSSKFQITFATLNLSVACFIFICGIFKADLHNWNLTKAEIPANAGEGGFLPFGFTGVIAGAGTCFFAFVGFDGIAATAEEVKNPRKAIPNSILWTSAIIFITYSGMSTIQTLIWPYWDQKQAAPLPYIFEKLGMPFAKWTVLVGVLAGLSTSFVGSFLPLPRILYAMARDGVIYRVLSMVSKRFRVPYVATIIGGILIGILASVLEIDQLADMLSIGTLAAYSLVSISVLLLRYEHEKPTNCNNPLPITYQEHVVFSGNKQQPANGTDPAAGANKRQENLVHAVNGVLTLKNEKPNGQAPPTTNGAIARAGHSEQKSDSSRSSSDAEAKDKQTGGCSTNKPNGSSSSTLSTAKNGTGSASDSRKGSTSSTSKGSSSSKSSSSLSLSSSEISNEKSSGADSNCSIANSSSSRSVLALFVDGTRGPGKETRRPDEQTTHISRVVILILVVVTTLLDFALVLYGPTLYKLNFIEVSVCGFLFALTLVLGFLLNRLPVAEPSTNSFEVPLVPTIPLFSVIINTYLMLNLSGKYGDE